MAAYSASIGTSHNQGQVEIGLGDFLASKLEKFADTMGAENPTEELIYKVTSREPEAPRDSDKKKLLREVHGTHRGIAINCLVHRMVKHNHWRICLKSLNLLDFFIEKGQPEVAREFMRHKRAKKAMRDMVNFQYIDGEDKGARVRAKAKEVSMKLKDIERSASGSNGPRGPPRGSDRHRDVGSGSRNDSFEYTARSSDRDRERNKFAGVAKPNYAQDGTGLFSDGDEEDENDANDMDWGEGGPTKSQGSGRDGRRGRDRDGDRQGSGSGRRGSNEARDEGEFTRKLSGDAGKSGDRNRDRARGTDRGDRFSRRRDASGSPPRQVKKGLGRPVSRDNASISASTRNASSVKGKSKDMKIVVALSGLSLSEEKSDKKSERVKTQVSNPAPEVDLLGDLMGGDDAVGDDDFGDFGDFGSAVANTATNALDDFGDFNAPAAQPQTASSGQGSFNPFATVDVGGVNDSFAFVSGATPVPQQPAQMQPQQHQYQQQNTQQQQQHQYQQQQQQQRQFSQTGGQNYGMQAKLPANTGKATPNYFGSSPTPRQQAPAKPTAKTSTFDGLVSLDASSLGRAGNYANQKQAPKQTLGQMKRP
ncbi:hypothetical protein SARC_03550 [Sphaeroforma arctica JP610]|uniref:ENTH domain-containing protein n=1 Tax=Sphaeroforma arctica JP610 TaxID=667725 RepID=A0A0L0G7L8_9EUKA|nr:hypothetical protein SARC_03550 [Sphaeroforma arctica JP610]KNC84218.1 hypothetical protein SARC_03550 [Sphaeroforma arctica JP610]|eukprot:XP_014158120.1 hypothetical protein SARC_03550 [Sphaeroforma arctica JP610]